MRNAIVVLFALWLAACGGSTGTTPSGPSSSGPSPSERGEQIVSQYLNESAAPFRKDRVRFTIRSDTDPVEIYEIDVWRRQMDGETDTLSMITKPADEAGATLAIEKPGQETTVAGYAVSRDEFKELDTNKIFLGGLTGQELLGEWSKYDYKFVGERSVDGRMANEVEGKLKKGSTSIIDSNRLAFDAETGLPLEIHLFDNTGKEIRSYHSTAIKEAGGHKYVARTEVENPIYDSHIIIEVLSREYPASIDNSFFQREKLKASVRK